MIDAGTNQVYQLHKNGEIWRSTGQPCSGDTCPGWQRLDNNPSTKSIVAAGLNLYQLHKDGEIWRHTGEPCRDETCPGWQRLDNNPRTKAIAAGGNQLYQLHKDGKIWRYTKNPVYRRHLSGLATVRQQSENESHRRCRQSALPAAQGWIRLALDG